MLHSDSLLKSEYMGASVETLFGDYSKRRDPKCVE
jgi:hypothetical protein